MKGIPRALTISGLVLCVGLAGSGLAADPPPAETDRDAVLQSGQPEAPDEAARPPEATAPAAGPDGSGAGQAPAPAEFEDLPDEGYMPRGEE